MNDDELARALTRSVDARTRKMAPRADVDDLFARVRRRSARQHRVLLGSFVAVLALAGVAGYLIGRSDEGGTTTVVAASGSIPNPRAGSSGLAPADEEAARAAVKLAFHDAYTGDVPRQVKAAAIQRGGELETLSRAALKNAQRFGYTAEQLAGTTVEVTSVLFIDETHAAVRFTISIPGHGDMLVDRIGYAVLDDGRWKVSLRTACDILSLGGLLQECPPA
jgi:hypothetical protein